ncbi:MAG: MFS family permease/MFS family permease [Chloroflexi bacterium]|nr:MAG: MFS family permease/MFS family permease [Chloroflexota bacterium]
MFRKLKIEKFSYDRISLTQRWLIAVSAGLGLYLLSLDSTVNVALPAITEEFGASLPVIQWIIIAYLSVRAAIVIGAGGLADRIGLKRIFILGLIVYTISVFAIGITPNLFGIFGLRVFQAIGAGMTFATAPAIVGMAFPQKKRGIGIGVVTAGLALGMVTGALAAGVLVDGIGWRYIFIFRIPIGFLVIFLSLLVIPWGNTMNDSSRPFDLLGLSLLLVGVVAFVCALSVGSERGWGAVLNLWLLLLTVLAFIGFFIVQLTVKQPAFKLSGLRSRHYPILVLTTFLAFLGIFVIWFVFPFYVSGSLGFGSAQLGLLMATLGTLQSAASIIGGRLSDRIKPFYLLTAGLIMVSFALFWMSSLGAHASLLDVAMRISFVGCGLGMFMTASITHALNISSSERYASASAGLSFSQTIGSVCSVSIASSLLSIGDGGQVNGFIAAFQGVFLLASIGVAIAASVSLMSWKNVSLVSVS